MEVALVLTKLSFCISLMVGGMSMGGKEVTAYFDKFLAGEMEVGDRVLQERNLGGKGGISIGGRW